MSQDKLATDQFGRNQYVAGFRRNKKGADYKQDDVMLCPKCKTIVHGDVCPRCGSHMPIL